MSMLESASSVAGVKADRTGGTQRLDVQPEQQKSAGVRLLEKQQLTFKLQDQLDTEKLKYARQEEDCRTREEALKQRDAELHESLVRFSKHLQENDAKHARAVKRAADERRQCQEKAAEAEQLEKLAEELRQQLVEAQREKTNNMRHQLFLQGVVEDRDLFLEIGDIITRYNVLAATNADLQQQQQRAAELSEQVRGNAQEFAKKRENEILTASNAIPILKKDLELLQQETYILEAKRNSAVQKAVQKALEHGQVCLAIDSLFQRCLQRSKVAHRSRASTLMQLDITGNYVSDIYSIAKEHQTVGVTPHIGGL